MTARTALLLLLSAAGCAGGRPVPREPPSNQPPLARSSIVAVLAHRSELDLSDEQVAALEQADAELQQRLINLRAEGGLPPPPPGGAGAGPAGGGEPPSGAPGAGRPGGGFGMNMGPGGRGLGGVPPGEGSRGGGPRAGSPRRDPARAQEALEARLDDADTTAFLKAEPVLTAAQRERAREIATTYREQLFERREAMRGR